MGYATGDCTYPLPICLPDNWYRIAVRKSLPERTAPHGTQGNDPQERAAAVNVLSQYIPVTESGCWLWRIVTQRDMGSSCDKAKHSWHIRQVMRCIDFDPEGLQT